MCSLLHFRAPNRADPHRIGAVLYQHRNLHHQDQGAEECRRKQAMKTLYVDSDDEVVAVGSRGGAPGTLSESGACWQVGVALFKVPGI